jgi:hypothetical protein
MSGSQFLALITPSDEGELMAQAMENWFQACASDEPFSLDLVGTAKEQQFLLRANSEAQRNLLCKQFEAHYPQADIRWLAPSEDPLRLRPGEHAMIGTFGLLQKSWMPLKTFTGKVLSESGSDPLIGVLAAMETIATDSRIISQLALVRAPEHWLSADLRKSVEHPLQHERDQTHLANTTSSSSSSAKETLADLRLLLLGVLLLGGIFVNQWYQAHNWLLLFTLGAVVLVALLVLCWWKIRSGGNSDIYDMKLVAEKMARAGFYSQLRVIVIAQEPVILPTQADRDRSQHIQRLEQQCTTLSQQIAAIQHTFQQAHAYYRDAHSKEQDKNRRAQLNGSWQQYCDTLNLQTNVLSTKRTRLLMKLRTFQEQARIRASERVQEQERVRQQHQLSLSQYLTNMEVAYRQYTSSSANGLYLKQTRYLRANERLASRLSSALHAFAYAHWWSRLLHAGAFSPWILNSLELAGMFHLPQEGSDVPLIRRISTKHLLFSPEISHLIATTPAPMPAALIGYSCHRRHRVPVCLPWEVVFEHKFAIGMSRSGKTWLLQLLLQAAMQPAQTAIMKQPGVFIIDPHRDMALDSLALISQARKADVLLLDMTNTEHVVALNPLDASMGFTRDQAVSQLMSCFALIWDKFWGPRMSYFLNAVCLLLYTLNQQKVRSGHADQQYTLLDINPLLQYKEYAIEVLSELDMSETWHQELMEWWQNTYFSLDEKFKQEVIMPILSKIGVFHDNEQLRRIVGQPVTKAPVHLAVTEGKIVICALSSRDMDDASVNILGSTLINLLHRSFSLQQDIPLLERRKIFVAIDELQNFSGSAYDSMLSESAKLGCAMMLTTQSLKRLNKIREGLLELILSNCQHLFAFRVSAEDAKVMESELQEKVSIKHIIAQPNLHCYARLALPGHPLQIASVSLLPPGGRINDPQQEQIVADILTTSQQQATPVDEIDQHYREHLKRFLNVQRMARRFKREARAAKRTRHQRDQDERLADEVKAASIDYTTVKAPDEADTSTPPPHEETLSSGADISSPHKKRRRRRRRKKTNQPSSLAQEDTTLDQDETDETWDDDEDDEDDDQGVPVSPKDSWRGPGGGAYAEREYGE